LDRIKASFRYCASCQLFVGRSCCWNPDAVACIVDAPPTAIITTAPAAVLGGSETAARRAVAELAASIGALGQLKDAIERVPQWEANREIRRRAWDDAWSTTGWLIARAETSRDAAAKALWRGPAQPVPPTTQDLNGQLLSLEEQYARTRATVEARLMAAAQSLAPDHPQKPVPARRRRLDSAILAGALGAVAVLAFGAAALLQLGYLDPFVSSRTAAATDPEGAVLGGGGGPVQSSAPASTPASTPVSTQAPFEPQAVVARLDFDQLRIGSLAGASDEIALVAGRADVVAFPSPFDRSIRAAGEGTHRFCVPNSTLVGGAIALEVDLYAETLINSGRLLLSMAPPAAAATAASVPLGLLGDLPSEAWHHLRAVLTPSQPVEIAIGDMAQGQVQTQILSPARDTRAVAGSVCIAVSGMPTDGVLLLDNLEVQQ
jgi:hypothetical protein